MKLTWIASVYRLTDTASKANWHFHQQKKRVVVPSCFERQPHATVVKVDIAGYSCLGLPAFQVCADATFGSYWHFR